MTIAGCLLGLPLSQGVAGPAMAEPPAWVPHTALIRLNDLPRHYSCDDLETRFRDVLLALGTRPDMDIRASACGAEGYSPQVRLQFATPSQLLGEPTVLTDANPMSRTVRLAPGQLSSWSRDDCELMRQLKDKLLPQMTVRVVAFSLSCLAPAVNSERYRVIVQAPHASSSPAKVAAVAADARPRAR